MAPSYRAFGDHRRDHRTGFPWVVKAMMSVIVVAAFVVLILVWSQSGAPSQIHAASADSMGPRPQDTVTSLSE